MGSAQFAGSVTVANEYTLLGNGSLYGTLSLVANTVTELKVGATKLNGRTTLFIQNNPNNDLLYIGLDNTVSTSKYGLILSAGQGVELKLDRIDNISIFCLSPSAGGVGVIEGMA